MRTRFIALAVLLLITSARAEEAPPTRTLGRVFEKLKAGQPTTVAYFGGSITAAAGYRVKTLKWFTDTFPQAKVTEVHAAIGGTGSDLGVFRCQSDVISKSPDLVFVEFSVNDGAPTNEFRKATMEGIVRQLWSSPSQPEIVFLYTTTRDLNAVRVSHPAVAKYYGIPDIDLQPSLLEALKRTDLPKPTGEQLANPKLDWKAPGQIFISDTVHPNDLGHTIYADTIIAWLKTQVDAKALPPPKLGKPYVSEEFAHVAMVAPSTARLIGDWEVLPADEKSGKIGRYKDGAINSKQGGDALEFEFEGTALGVYQSVQADGGKYEWTIDDGVNGPSDPGYGGPRGVKHGSAETAPMTYFPRYSYAMLTTGLAPGKHTLKLRVLPEHDKSSTGNRVLIGYFMVGGLPAAK
jgi:lysophospholipase L1-like esterase